MLDAMRRGVANVFAKILLGLLVVAFAFWGIGNYDVLRRSQSNTLATVGKTQITLNEYRQAYKEESQAIARRLGRALKPEEAQLFGVPEAALERLMGVAAIDLHADSLGITVTDDFVRDIIRADPRFAGPNGQFSLQRFLDDIGQRGYRSEDAYVRAARRDLIREQITETLSSGVAPEQFVIDAQNRYRNETRVIEFISAELGKLVTVADPSEDKLKAFFEQHRGQYIALEQRKANLLLLTRDQAMSRIKVTDEEVKAAYESEKAAYNVPERRRIEQLTFPDKAAAEKAYAELSKAKDFGAAAAKLGFSANDIQLGAGPLAKSDMIDPKIADAAFKLKKDELSQPVQGQFSVVLLRVTAIEGGQQRSFDDVKSEIRDRIATERVGEEIQSLHDAVEAGRTKGTPLKEIADELKLPFKEIAGVNRLGKTGDGKAAIANPDAARITEAFFGAAPGIETEAIELSDSGYAWFDLLGITPERQRTFEEAAADVRTSYMEAERQKQIADLVAKQIDGLKPGEALDKIAKAVNGKVERTAPVKRNASPLPAGVTAPLLQQAFGLAKGTVASAPSADGRSRIIFRVADIIAAPSPTAEETAAIKADLTRQMRLEVLAEYVAGLRGRYGATVNEKLRAEALGAQPGQQGID